MARLKGSDAAQFKGNDYYLAVGDRKGC